MSTAVVEGFEVVDLEDLDAAGVLDALSDSDLQERRATAWKLALAYQWAVLHPAPVESNILESPETLGGDGTPEVAAFTAEPLAVRLRITPAAAAALVGDALDLVHRHPRLWRKVQALRVPAWQARQVAQQTRRLPLTSARWVDEQLAARADDACGATVVPVLTMSRGDAVDVHDPPRWMRDLVILRDQHCVFPGCTRDARTCDLDHIEPYHPDRPPDSSAGHTHPDNLACLCRRHHRAKTLGLWRYTRTPDGNYQWRGPTG